MYAQPDPRAARAQASRKAAWLEREKLRLNKEKASRLLKIEQVLAAIKQVAEDS